MSLQTPPKKKRIKRVYRHPNLLFEKWLQEWCDEAKARESQMKFNYARAIKSLKSFPLPLYRGADCKVLSGFGDKICQQIDRRLEKHIQEFGPINWDEYHQVVEHSAPRKKQAKKTSSHTESNSSDGPNNESLRKSGKKRCRPYVPAVRSGAYAILMAFNKASSDDGFPDHLKRTEVVENAQEFCDSSFTQSPDGSHYTAWSSMSTLLRKNLITKEGCPARYSLTISGEDMCTRLVSAEGGTNMQLHLSQESLDDPDDPGAVSDNNCEDLSEQELRRKNKSNSFSENTKKSIESITNQRKPFGNPEIDKITSSLLCSNRSPTKKSQDDWSYSDPEDLQEYENYSDSFHEESILKKNQNYQETITVQHCKMDQNLKLSTVTSNIPKHANVTNKTVSETILNEFENCTLTDSLLSQSSILTSEMSLSSNSVYLSQALNFTMNTEKLTLEAASMMVALNSCHSGNTLPCAQSQYSISMDMSSSSKGRSSRVESEVSQLGSFENLSYNLQSDMEKLSKDSLFFENTINNKGEYTEVNGRLTSQNSCLHGDSFGSSTCSEPKNKKVGKTNPMVENEMYTHNSKNRRYERKDQMENAYKSKKYWKRNEENDGRKNRYFSEDLSKPNKKWSFNRNKRRKRKTESSSDEEITVFVPEIADAPKEPQSAIVPPINSSVITTSLRNLVFFDLETTSLRMDCDIVQIAAIDGSTNDTFDSYVLPTKKMDKMASYITGISYKKGILRHNFKPVYAKPALKALENFLFWIQQRTPVTLVAHNASFDSKRLFYSLHLHRLTAEFKKHIIGFVDTLALFKIKYPNLPNHRQETVVKQILNIDYEAHNALEDVKSLKDVYNASFLHNSTKHLEKKSIDFASAHEQWLYEWEGKKRASTFSEMLSKRCVSENMVDKMANSGLTKGNLEFIYKSKGVNGIELLLGEIGVHGKPRVTKNKRVINDIAKYFTIQSD